VKQKATQSLLASMNEETNMKTTTTKSGIGRRRGAKKKKSLKTSLVVSLVTFCVTFFIIMGVYLARMSSSDQIRATSEILKDAPFVEKTAKFLKKRHKQDVGRHGHAIDDEIETSQSKKDKKLELILRSEVHLIDIQLYNVMPSKTRPGGYVGAKATFCKLDWDLHKNNPPNYPMFRFLVSS